MFTSVFSSRARGVMTLIHETVPFHVHNVIKDKRGRYLIIQGSLLLEKLNLINIYGPNSDDSKFYEDLFLSLSALPGTFIIAEDVNCTLNSCQDRSTRTDLTHNNSRLSILQSVTELKLSDIWRELNPHTKAYSCYSATFQTYSLFPDFI